MSDQQWSAPPVESIKGLGTSWFRRGPSYWARRVLATVLYAIILCIGALLVGGLVMAINKDANSIGRAILWTVVVAVVAVSHYLGFRDMNPRRQQIATPKRRSGATGAGLGAGVAAFGGSALGAGILAIGMFAGVGWFTAMFVYSLTRYPSATELQAVQKMRDWYAQHPEIPDNQRPHQFRRAALGASER
ncbi:hypothetical protein [Nocardia sp. CDC160]|uniref:hypothetical protein n=1 Tax=Nocardia sp. CDC160 TaxID=3112166 RepID=UPI002DB71CCC|nr:hypothetical protein [Nocardia sp. CDC160]MEC3915479.1 hypothetical protein [Nocardia sp. CDC160]